MARVLRKVILRESWRIHRSTRWQNLLNMDVMTDDQKQKNGNLQVTFQIQKTPGDYDLRIYICWFLHNTIYFDMCSSLL